MSQIYTTRRRAVQKEGGMPAPASLTKIPNSARSAAIEHNMDAIAAVRPHEGRRLSLDETMVNRMQEQFGIRMDQVELRESSQPADMDAKAFAKGNVVQFAPGQFRPDTVQGQQLIQHELAHVAQQARGGVRADVEGLNVNADERLEHQADMGNLTASTGAPASLSGISAETAPVQGLFGGIKKWFKKRRISEPTLVDENHLSNSDAQAFFANEHADALKKAEAIEDKEERNTAIRKADNSYGQQLNLLLSRMSDEELAGNQDFQNKIVSHAGKSMNRQLHYAESHGHSSAAKLNSMTIRGSVMENAQRPMSNMLARMLGGSDRIRRIDTGDNAMASMRSLLIEHPEVVGHLQNFKNLTYQGTQSDFTGNTGRQSRSVMNNFVNRVITPAFFMNGQKEESQRLMKTAVVDNSSDLKNDTPQHRAFMNILADSQAPAPQASAPVDVDSMSVKERKAYMIRKLNGTA